MPNVSGIAALDVLIGLFFLYFLLSIVCSSINEGISSLFRIRAAYLERGICALISDPGKVREFYDHWRMKTLIKPPGKLVKKARKPSYLPSHIFALTLLDNFAPPRDAASDDLIGRATEALGPEAPVELNDTVRGLLQDALTEARGEVERFKASIERSFDDVMDRASGWYKRKIQFFLFVIAFVLVIGINADSYAIGQRLWQDDALRAAVVAQANKVVAAGDAACVTDEQQQGETSQAASCVSQVEELGLPFGWSHENRPDGFWTGLAKVMGLLVTTFALTLGAPFWFDLMGKVAHLRGTGPPKPTTSGA